MPKAKPETNIPLRCSLCPKTPQFSDVSHLLTHISSKSHLSHRFKLQIRAQSEMASKQQLDNFDHWYTHNNLDVMLSDRMAAKEHKKNTKDRKARLAAVCYVPLGYETDANFIEAEEGQAGTHGRTISGRYSTIPCSCRASHAPLAYCQFYIAIFDLDG